VRKVHLVAAGSGGVCLLRLLRERSAQLSQRREHIAVRRRRAHSACAMVRECESGHGQGEGEGEGEGDGHGLQADSVWETGS
jgi:hypothetical protein